jgi:hypothetical protein
LLHARAREERADHRAEKIDEIAELTLQGHAARVAIDAQKWLAAKEMPRRYGDHLNVEANVAVKDYRAMTDAELKAEIAQQMQVLAHILDS